MLSVRSSVKAAELEPADVGWWDMETWRVLRGLRAMLLLGMAMLLLFGAASLATSETADAQSCTDDEFEENDSPAAATSASSGDSYQAQVCPNDQDWFSIDLTVGQTVVFDLLFDHDDGDIDMVLYDNAGNTLTSSTSSSDDESINWPVTTAGPYNLLIFGFSGAQNSYILNVTVSSPCDGYNQSGTMVSTSVTTKAELAAAIKCFNDQTIQGDYEVTLSNSISYNAGETVETIDGDGTHTLTIEGNGHSLSGPGVASAGDHLVDIAGSSKVVLRAIVIANSASRGIQVGNSIESLQIFDSRITNPTAQGLFVNGGDVLVVNSVLSGGTAGIIASGGDIGVYNSTIQTTTSGIDQNGATLRVSQSTISGVTTGVKAFGFRPATILNSTIVASGTAVEANSDGSTMLVSSVIDGSCAGTFRAGSTANFADDNTCGNSTVFAGLLRPLTDAGCGVPVAIATCVQVHPLGASNAVDAGVCTDLAEQRGDGFPRSIGPSCDAGAVESSFDCALPYEVTSESEYDNAIQCYNVAPVGSFTKIFVNGDLTLSATPTSIDHYAASPPSLEIFGNGHTIDANGVLGDPVRVVNGSVIVSDLTIRGSNDDAVQVVGGTVTLRRVTAVDNEYGVYATGGILKIFQSTISETRFVGVSTFGGSVELTQVTIADGANHAVSVGLGSISMDGVLLARNAFPCAVAAGGTLTNNGGSVSEGVCGPLAATPNLGATLAPLLADNGCSTPCTQTYAILPGSPAIDAAGNCGPSEGDQRGFARLVGPACDAGSYESVPQFCNNNAVTIDLTLGMPGTGTAGNDVILGTSGADVIDGLGGDDTICAGAGHDVVNGGAGDDLIFGGWGSDRLFGDGDDDELYGQGNADYLVGGQGSDLIDGGDKSDRIYGDENFVSPNGGADVISAGAGSDLVYAGAGDDVVYGSWGADRLFGQQGADEMYGDAGNDKLYGGSANDKLYGGNDIDRMWGETGHDTVSGEAGHDSWLDGGAHNDKVYGGSGNDVIRGGDGRDKVYGQGGNDDVRAQAGDDWVTDGGSGIDSCQVAPGVDVPHINCE